MKRLYNSIFQIAETCVDVACMFSCGRDSTVMLDLFMQYAPNTIKHVIFLYFCPELSYEEKILRYYEDRYRINIIRRAHPDVGYLLNYRDKKHKVTMGQFEKAIRAEGYSWIAYAYRKDESLQRRGQLSLAPNGIDAKYRKLFPIAEWAQRHVNKCRGRKKTKKIS